MAVDAMRIVVKGKNIQITPALREYSEKRAGKIRKFFPEDISISVDVALSVEGDFHVAELTVHAQGLVIRGESRTEDMYASIDACIDRVERQVRRHKTRLQKRFHDAPKLGAFEAQRATEDRAVQENNLPRVVRTKRFAIKPMDVDEALMQMDLLGHDFFVFANAATDEVNVLYRRKDGNVGLIEPEYD